MGKVTPLREALEEVPDGGHVGFGGFAITRNVTAAAHELIRLGRTGLTLTQCVGGLDTDLLVGGGAVRRLIYSGGSLDRFGLLYAVNAAVVSGRIEVQEYSSLALALRLHAAGLGLPFVPSRSMLGSDLLEPLIDSGGVEVGVDPFGGSPVVLMPPLRPDVAVVHVDVADEAGNSCLAGPTWTIPDLAFAAGRTIVLCEEVVPVGSIPPERVVIPGAIVEAVCVVPRGAHPSAVYGRYDYDAGHLRQYVETVRTGSDGMTSYLDRYVRGVSDFEEYLREVGA